MNDAQRERLKEVLLILEGLSPAEQTAWIARRLADDAELQAEVRSLLEASSHGDDRVLTSLVTPPASISAGTVPSRIGRYVIDGLLGQGGMSNVYRAYVDVPQRQAVALKVLRPGRASAELLDRFAGESQVIARLDHRNIARLIEVGSDDNGLPYIVMDLVDGPPITEYAKLHQLDLRQRLELFVQACRGVQHAHNRGILHRDLKPSNILVGEHEGKPLARVIDFGLAKLLDPDNAANHTLHGQILGTVAYMSPEQADPVNPDADVRSDVYSLGVVLYELIAGRNPTRESDLAGKAPVELHRLLQMRRLEPPSVVAGEKQRDIDCVALKAMEPDPDARYAGAGLLADDVERYLKGESILARPPSRGQLLVRAIRRNRAVSAAIAIAVLALLAGVLGLSLGLRRAIAEEKRATAAQASAVEERDRAARAAAVYDEVSLVLRRLILTPRQGVNAPYLEILQRGAQDFLERPPESVPVRARVGYALGQALHQAGDRALSRSLLSKVIEDLGSSQFDSENAPMRDSMLFTSYTMLAGIERTSGSDERAEQMWTRAIELGRTLEGVSPSEIIAASMSYADVLAARGDLERAERAALDAKHTALEQSVNARLRAIVDGVLAGVYARMQRFDEAIALGAAAYQTRSTGRDNSAAFTVMIGIKHARSLLGADKPAEAETVLTHVATLAEQVLGPRHVDTLYAQQLLILARARQRTPEQDVIPTLRALVPEPAPGEGPLGGRIWRARAVIVECLIAMGRTSEAEEAARVLESEFVQARGADSRDVALLRWDMGRAFRNSSPENAVKLLTAAWTTYAHDLGESALACRLIARDVVECLGRLNRAKEAQPWRARAQADRSQ